MFSSRHSTASRRLRYSRAFALPALALLAMLLSCARLPPANTNALSGKRLRVTMTFQSPIEPNFYYFFVINNAGNQNAPGPIAVLSRGPNGSYGNGFATGIGGQKAFTDFVEIDNRQPQGYGLRHVIDDPALSRFSNPVRPISALPLSSDPTQQGNQIQFEIDLAQLITNTDGSPLTSASQAVSLSRAIRYLQVNIIATDQVPHDVTTDVPKEVDSMGDTRTTSGQTSYLTLDLGESQTNYHIYRSDDANFLNIQEPSDDDTFAIFGAAHNQALNLTSWQIEFANFTQ